MSARMGEVLGKLDKLKQEKAVIDCKIREYESALKQAHQLSGQTGWINTGLHRFRVSKVVGRKTLDRAALEQSLEQVFQEANITGISAKDLIASCEREGSPSTRLNTMPLN